MGIQNYAKHKKNGFTLLECMIATLVLSILLIATIPFLTNIKVKQSTNSDIQAEIAQEYSDINYALASNTLYDLNTRNTSNIEIEKVEGTERLYKVTGVSTGAYGYVVLKSN
jgi:prepilin-type N-terminal cleavage/methylation domain-containing protein